MKRIPLFICFAIIAVGFGMSLHKSLTGNGLLDENLDSHILAQLDDSGDDTGGDDTTGGDKTGGDKTGGDKTGGDETGGPDAPYIIKGSKLESIEFTYKDLSDNMGHLYTMSGTSTGLKPNSWYDVTIEYSYCEVSNPDDKCDKRKEGYETISVVLDRNASGPNVPNP